MRGYMLKGRDRHKVDARTPLTDFDAAVAKSLKVLFRRPAVGTQDVNAVSAEVFRTSTSASLANF